MQEVPKLPKKLQESPQDAPREPKASEKLSQEALNPPKRVHRSSPKSIKIDKNSIREPTRPPRAPKVAPRPICYRFFFNFRSILGSILRAKTLKKELKNWPHLWHKFLSNFQYFWYQKSIKNWRKKQPNTTNQRSKLKRRNIKKNRKNNGFTRFL